MSVDYVRPEVTAQESRWEVVQDCARGQDAVKAKRERYLPKPNAADVSPQNEARYKAYLERAVFYAVTKRTLDGLIGLVFARPPQVEIPDEMDVLTVDADGAGIALDQQARRAVSEVLSFGRCGILADYPPTLGAVTKADQESGFVRPTLTLYEHHQAINWRTVTVGAKRVFSLVVLAETCVVENGDFEETSARQFRVLRLVPPPPPENAPPGWKADFRKAIYRVELWREVVLEGETTGMELSEVYEPRDSSGMPLREIPFTFVGALNNDPTVDPAPLYDLAVLNIAHFRNSADYEESCYLAGQPTPWVAGLTQEWVDENFKGKALMLGSRAVIPLPQGGGAGLLQASANSMPKEAMEAKERQMVALGAKLVEQRQVQRTAEEAGQEAASESSILATVAQNVSRAYTDGLEWCAAFMGASFPEVQAVSDGDSEPETIRYELNSEYPASKLAAQDLQALVGAWQAGAIARSEMRSALRSGGLAKLDDAAAQEEIDSDPARPGAAFVQAMDAPAAPVAPQGEAMTPGKGMAE